MMLFYFKMNLIQEKCVTTDFFSNNQYQVLIIIFDTAKSKRLSKKE